MKTGLVYSEKYLEHRPLDDEEIESPSRLKAIIRKLENEGMMSSLEHLTVEHNSAIVNEMINHVHPPHHVKNVETISRTPDICRLAVAGCISGAKAIAEGKVKNAFCAVRPPGHHASSRGAFGFCYFNNAAIAARYLQKYHGLKNLLIIDWDYHHGNGTEEIFYEDSTVFYFSTHRLDTFPWTGHKHRTGAKNGEGFNMNIPLPSGTEDKDIIDVYEKKLIPIADHFKPDFIIISAGFDSRKDDLLGDFNLTDDCFMKLTKIVMEIAQKHSSSRVLSILEGGYNFKGLASSVYAHIKTLCNYQDQR